jgi:hypothetical protein
MTTTVRLSRPFSLMSVVGKDTPKGFVDMAGGHVVSFATF